MCGRLAVTGGGFGKQNLLFAGGNEGTDTTPPFASLLFQSPAALTPTAEESLEGEGNNLYLSTSGQLHLVSILPDGVSDANAVFGAPALEPSVDRPDFDNVISGDGQRVYFTALNSGQIYLRENPSEPSSPLGPSDECTLPTDGCTVAVSDGDARFWTATPDGRYAFYTEAGQLWQFDATNGSRTMLVGQGVHSEPAGVDGVVGASNDGTDVYFVAEAALDVGAEVRKCREPQEEEQSATPEEKVVLEREQIEENEGRIPSGRGCNLYVLHRGQTAHFIAALAAKDDRLHRGSGRGTVTLGAWQPSLGSRTAEVTPDGHKLAFESTQELTGYDNSSLDSRSEEGLEVFIFDASRGSGRLMCASCDPRGAPPQLVPEGGTEEGVTYLPVSASPVYMRRWMSEDGTRVFYNTLEPLDPHDTNGVNDVYEWEEEGTEGCPQATSVGGGCIFMLSGGNSRFRSFFVDASVSGGDVFFTHRGQLGQANPAGGKNALFDVRVDGGFPEVATGCQDGSCEGATPPTPSPSSSPTLSAPGGNPPAPAPRKSKRTVTRAQMLAKALKTCKPKRKAARKRCEAAARRRFGSKPKKSKRGGARTAPTRRAGGGHGR